MASILFKVVRICKSQFKCNYLKNQKLFLNFLFDLWNLHQILNILKKNMMVIANVLPKLQTVDILVRPLSEKSRFRTRFDIQHVLKYFKYFKKSVPNICEISMRAILSCFFIILREIDLENVSFTVR